MTTRWRGSRRLTPAPRRTAARIAIALVIAGLATVFMVSAWRLARPPAHVPPTLAVGEALGGPIEGFARALAPRPFVFPADHGPHAEFRTEWWYYTGNLSTADGRHFGFQLTFFRIAMAPTMISRASAWASREAYMAHFALTDTAGRRFSAASRLSRAALDLADAHAHPFKVWVEDWSAEGVGGDAVPVKLRAAEGDVAIDLTLASAKPVVLQGDRGLDRKGEEPGNASYYYSLTRMPTKGRVTIHGAAFEVTGLAWMDREWSTSSLGAGLMGWDWFALQLADGRDLMLYQLRRADGSADRFSSGSLVGVDGTSRRLSLTDFRIDALETWTSPRDGTRYPSRWRITIPSESLDLDVVPRLADQELALAVRYWEGAVRVVGRDRGRPIAGVGYIELVGYTRGR
ncbi:MAG TPA: lipocalin-like domain-containing protein [Candidatus Acidoferrum sp.]|nr:lipocalin-like domain-containing protein [Candidatus Acidoferrum sp.]